MVSPMDSADYTAKPLGQSNTQPHGINNDAATFLANRKGRSAHKQSRRMTTQMAGRAKSK